MKFVSSVPVATMALVSTASAWSPSLPVLPPIGLSSSGVQNVIPTGSSSQLIPSTTTTPGSLVPSGSSTLPATGTSGKPHGSGAGPTGTGGSHTSTIPTIPATTVTESAGKSTFTNTVYETKTFTNTITKFVPTSSAVATVGDTTYYSTSLTTSLTTTVYTTIVPQVTVIVPTPGNGLGSSAAYCPPAATVYVTVTVNEGGAVQAPTQANNLPQPSSASNSNISTPPQSSDNGAQSSPLYPLPSGSSTPIGSGTGTGSVIRPTGSVSATGKHPHYTASSH